MLGNSLFGDVKLIENVDPGKYNYSGCYIGFDTYGSFSLSDGCWTGKNVIMFDTVMSSLVDINNKKKVDEGLTDGLDNTTLTVEKEYSINFTHQQKQFSLSLHYNEVHSYLFVNDIETFQFKAKDSEINAVLLFLDNVSKDFSVDNVKETGLYGYVCDFSVDYDSIKCSSIMSE